MKCEVRELAKAEYSKTARGKNESMPMRATARTQDVHPVSVTRFPSFRTQTLENLSHYL